jgi:hypothetical protein
MIFYFQISLRSCTTAHTGMHRAERVFMRALKATSIIYHSLRIDENGIQIIDDEEEELVRELVDFSPLQAVCLSFF